MNATLKKPSTTCAGLPCKRERTRTLLIEAGIDVLAERGLEGVSIDELMRQAGMARGTFYNHFQTREELTAAISQHIREKIFQLVVDPIPAQYSHEAVFACVSYGFIQYGLQHPTVGWALVRIGGSSQWVSGERFDRAHNALRALMPAPASPFMGLIYIEGVALMVLRRLLEGAITQSEADTVFSLAMRGAGIAADQIPALLEMAQQFVQSLDLHS